MSQPLVYVDTSAVREGALEQLKHAIGELANFVEENEPQLISYNVYFSEDGTQMSVVHVHADSASLDYHMDVAGPRFGGSPTSSGCHRSTSTGSRARRRSASCMTRCVYWVRRRDRPRAACRVQPV